MTDSRDPILIGRSNSRFSRTARLFAIELGVDDQGPLYADRVILRGDVADRALANAEEMVLHAMSTAVVLVMASRFRARFGERGGARAIEYRFDTSPAEPGAGG